MFLNREHETYLGTSTEVEGIVEFSYVAYTAFYFASFFIVIAKEGHGINTFVFKGSDCFWQIEDARFQYNG